AVHYITRTDRYIAARKVLLDRLDGEFLAMKPAVLDALRRGLDSADDNVAVRASEVWMRATGLLQHGKGEASSSITAEDVVRPLLTVAVNVNVDGTSAQPAGRVPFANVRRETEQRELSVDLR